MKIVTWVLLGGAFIALASSSLVAQEAPAGQKPKDAPEPAAPASPAPPASPEGTQPPAPAPGARGEESGQTTGSPAAPSGTPAGTPPVAGGFDWNYLGTPEAKPVGETSEYITLAVKDRDLAEVLRFIGRQVGVNIIPDPEVKEKVSVELDRVEWRKALDVIARLTHCKI